MPITVGAAILNFSYEGGKFHPDSILNFRVTQCKKVKNHFWHPSSENIGAINLGLGTDTYLKSSKMTVEFEVGCLEFATLILQFFVEVMGVKCMACSALSTL